MSCTIAVKRWIIPALLAVSAVQAAAQVPSSLQQTFADGAAAVQSGNYAVAVDLFTEILSRTESRADATSRTYARYAYLWRGIAYLRSSRFSHAIGDLETAARRAEQAGDHEVYLSATASLGDALAAVSRYDEAKRVLDAGLERALATKAQAYLVAFYRSLGNVEFGWGDYEQALDYYEPALERAESAGSVDDIVTVLDAMGRVYLARWEFEQAVRLFERAVREGGDSPYVTSAIDGLGIAYLYTERYEQALASFARTAELAEATGNAIGSARAIVHTGAALQQLGRYSQAIDAYRRALAINESLERDVDAAVCLTNLGYVAMLQEEYATADDYLLRSIAIKNRLRETATGFDRVSYLESEIKTFALLVQARLLAGDVGAAFAAAERSSSAYLREQIAGSTSTGAAIDEKLLRSIQERLDPGTLMLRYVVLPKGQYGLFAITREEATGQIIQPEGDGSAIPADTQVLAQADLRGLSVIGEAALETSPAATDAGAFYETASRYYELLLAPAYGTQERDQRDALAALLYEELLGPVEEMVEEASRVIVVPTGILTAIPFESLRRGDGRYLIEDVDVSYAYSATVALILSDRRTEGTLPPPSLRRSILAIGGADYEGADWTGAAIEPIPTDERAIALSVEQSLADGDARAVLQALGVEAWSDLPGTAAEIGAIRQMMPDGEFLIGEAANEASILELSENGRLAEFSVLHIAAHGFSLERYPQLSSLVLGQQIDRGADGYLTAAEIAELDLVADFVALSACQTGLGRLYLGEGVVGLAHAFITAGAQSLLVSLWQVADDSTSEFMVELYRRVAEEGITYAEATSQTKRAFVGDGRFADPFFWAPFAVYATLGPDG